LGICPSFFHLSNKLMSRQLQITLLCLHNIPLIVGQRKNLFSKAVEVNTVDS
jgi:hypothetical protein